MNDHIRRLVTKAQLIETVNANSRLYPRTMYMIKFHRSVPKCTRCGRKSRKWTKGIDTCCNCGGTIEYDKTIFATIRSMGEDGFMYFENGVTMKRCITDNIQSVIMPLTGNMIEMFLVKF